MKLTTIFKVGILFSTVFLLTSLKPDDAKQLPLPNGYNTLFAGSGECLLCHNSMVDGQGNNIGILNYWKSTMMANASKDPFWRAKVSYEVIKNPELQEEIESTCTRCHAPQGSFNAFHNGQAYYSLNELYTDPLANDGVSCSVCHQILEESHGNFSGQIEFGTDHQIYGPYSNIFPNPMVQHTGYTPVYGAHIKDSELCANCHTLLTPTVDLNGQLTGTYFTEQAIFQEWKNSAAHENQISCQACHIPEIQESVVISSMPSWLTGQTPFGKHELVGGNVFMLQILKNNIEALGLTASEADFDATISRTLTKLQEESISLNLSIHDRTEDSLFVELLLENLAGHKIPTGYPSRQIFVQLVVTNENDESVFISGETDTNGQIIHEALPYEPHHDIINSPEQTQIYQMVMADVEGNVTTTLLHADHSLKDNRLVPIGFSNSHPSYDTIAIVGEALNDGNFNQNQNGVDIVNYHIPIQSYTGQLNVEAKVFYQTVNNRWLEEMFNESSDEIDSFENMYNQADLNPILMSSKSVVSQSVGVNSKESNEFMIMPNPVQDYLIISNSADIESINIYSYQGQLISSLPQAEINNRIRMIEKSGVYLLEIIDRNQKSQIKKIIKN